MESLITEIYQLIDILIKSDPAIYRVMIFDPSGTEIYQYAKMWNKAKKYTSVGAMIGQIFNNAHKFLGFMKRSQRDQFVYYWNFDNAVIISASSDYGYIALLCEKDVDLGFVKTILLRKAMPLFINTMKPIFD